MDGRPTRTDCDEAGDYVVPNVSSLRDLVPNPDIMDANCTKHIINNLSFIYLFIYFKTIRYTVFDSIPFKHVYRYEIVYLVVIILLADHNNV